MSLQESAKLEHRRAGSAWAGALIAVFVVTAYYNSLSCPFFFDDLNDIVEGRFIRTLVPPWGAMFGPNETAAAGRPMVGLSLAVNYAISGLSPWSYHLLNIAMHVVSALLLMGVVRRTLMRGAGGDRLAAGATWIAFAAALLWAVHPLQTESVTYIIKRNESMMGMFYLLTLYAFIRSIEPRSAESSDAPAKDGRSMRWAAASVVACALGMASKEVMVTAPVMIFLYDVIFVSRSWIAPLRRRWGFYFCLAATWLILAGLIARSPRGETTGFSLAGITPMKYLLTQAGVLLHYLQLSVWPRSLCVDYLDWPLAQRLAEVAWQAAVVVGLIVLTAWGVLRRSPLGFVGAWFFVILSPSSSVVPIREPACEYRMYLPLAALVVLVACGLWVLVSRSETSGIQRRQSTAARGERRGLFAFIAIAIAIALSVRTQMRNRDYASPEVMWADAVRLRPDNPRAHGNLAAMMSLRREFDGATRHHLIALRLNEDHLPSILGMGNIHAQSGREIDAIEFYQRGLKLDADNAGVLANLGTVYAQMGRYGSAIETLNRALELRPDLTMARLNLAHAYLNAGKKTDAAREYSRVVDEQPGNWMAREALDRLRGMR